LLLAVFFGVGFFREYFKLSVREKAWQLLLSHLEVHGFNGQATQEFM